LSWQSSGGFQHIELAHFDTADMSPAALTPEPTFQVLPVIKRKEQKFNFGAVVEGLNLNDISGNH
jgi:hypothetical protein